MGKHNCFRLFGLLDLMVTNLMDRMWSSPSSASASHNTKINWFLAYNSMIEIAFFPNESKRKITKKTTKSLDFVARILNKNQFVKMIFFAFFFLFWSIPKEKKNKNNNQRTKYIFFTRSKRKSNIDEERTYE